MIDGPLFWVWLVVVALCGYVTRPQRAQCPPNEYVEGVRRDGSTWCASPPTGPEEDCRGARECHTDAEMKYTRPLKIYCTGGAVPIVVDARTIGCQR